MNGNQNKLPKHSLQDFYRELKGIISTLTEHSKRTWLAGNVEFMQP